MIQIDKNRQYPKKMTFFPMRGQPVQIKVDSSAASNTDLNFHGSNVPKPKCTNCGLVLSETSSELEQQICDNCCKTTDICEICTERTPLSQVLFYNSVLWNPIVKNMVPVECRNNEHLKCCQSCSQHLKKAISSMWHVCRCCERKSYLTDLFHDSNNEILEVLTNILKLSITINDGLPRYICLYCKGDLNRIKVFHKCVINRWKMFTKIQSIHMCDNLPVDQKVVEGNVQDCATPLETNNLKPKIIVRERPSVSSPKVQITEKEKNTSISVEKSQPNPSRFVSLAKTDTGFKLAGKELRLISYPSGSTPPQTSHITASSCTSTNLANRKLKMLLPRPTNIAPTPAKRARLEFKPISKTVKIINSSTTIQPVNLSQTEGNAVSAKLVNFKQLFPQTVCTFIPAKQETAQPQAHSSSNNKSKTTSSLSNTNPQRNKFCIESSMLPSPATVMEQVKKIIIKKKDAVVLCPVTGNFVHVDAPTNAENVSSSTGENLVMISEGNAPLQNSNITRSVTQEPKAVATNILEKNKYFVSKKVAMNPIRIAPKTAPVKPIFTDTFKNISVKNNLGKSILCSKAGTIKIPTATVSGLQAEKTSKGSIRSNKMFLKSVIQANSLPFTQSTPHSSSTGSSNKLRDIAPKLGLPFKKEKEKHCHLANDFPNRYTRILPKPIALFQNPILTADNILSKTATQDATQCESVATVNNVNNVNFQDSMPISPQSSTLNAFKKLIPFTTVHVGKLSHIPSKSISSQNPKSKVSFHDSLEKCSNDESTTSSTSKAPHQGRINAKKVSHRRCTIAGNLSEINILPKVYIHNTNKVSLLKTDSISPCPENKVEFKTPNLRQTKTIENDAKRVSHRRCTLTGNFGEMKISPKVILRRANKDLLLRNGIKLEDITTKRPKDLNNISSRTTPKENQTNNKNDIVEQISIQAKKRNRKGEPIARSAIAERYNNYVTEENGVVTRSRTRLRCNSLDSPIKNNELLKITQSETTKLTRGRKKN